MGSSRMMMFLHCEVYKKNWFQFERARNPSRQLLVLHWSTAEGYPSAFSWKNDSRSFETFVWTQPSLKSNPCKRASETREMDHHYKVPPSNWSIRSTEKRSSCLSSLKAWDRFFLGFPLVFYISPWVMGSVAVGQLIRKSNCLACNYIQSISKKTFHLVTCRLLLCL